MPDKQTKQFVIIGMGRFGKSLAETVYSAGHNVLAVDKEEEEIQKLESERIVTFSAICDAKDKDALAKLGINEDFDVGVVCIGEDTLSSILSVLILKELGVKKVIAKAIDRLQVQVLKKIGVDEIVFPEVDTGKRLGFNLINSHILEELEVSSDYSVVELEPPANMIGKRLKDLQLRDKFSANILCIKRGSEINPNPRADTELSEKDILVMFMPKSEADDFK